MSTTTKLYVAIVDDGDSFCRSVGQLLRAAGMNPIGYPSAEAFLADTKRPQFDCLLLDIQLPGITGIELCERLAAGGSKTPVIYLTASENPEVRERALRTACAAYLRKTEPSTAVLDAIRQAIRADNHFAESPS